MQSPYPKAPGRREGSSPVQGRRDTGNENTTAVCKVRNIEVDKKEKNSGADSNKNAIGGRRLP